VDQLARWDFGLDGVEEADELLMAMALHATSDDLAFEYVEGGEQRGGAVTLVIMGHGAGAALLHGKPGWVRSSAWIWLFSSPDKTMV